MEVGTGCLESRGLYGGVGDVPIYKVVQESGVAGIFSGATPVSAGVGRKSLKAGGGRYQRERERVW